MADLENGMRWRVMVELIGADGVVLVHEVSAGGKAEPSKGQHDSRSRQ
jgi:hypothetical protein